MSNLPPAGWYPDPANPGGTRYWNGTQWTADVAAGPGPASSPYGGQLPSSYGPGGSGPGRGLPDIGDYLSACFSTGFRAIVALGPQVLAILAAVVLLGGALLASSDVDNWLDEITTNADSIFVEDTAGNVEYVGPDWPGLSSAEIPLVIVLGVVLLLGSIWLGVASVFVLVDLAAGREARIPRTGDVVAAFGRLLVLGLLAALAFIGAMIVLVVAGAAIDPAVAILLLLPAIPLMIWLAIRLSLVLTIATVEGGITSAIGESWRRTSGLFWGLFGRYLLYGLILSIASQIVSTIVGVGASTGVSGAFAVSLLASIVIQLVSSVFNSAAATVAHVAVAPAPASTGPAGPADPTYPGGWS